MTADGNLVEAGKLDTTIKDSKTINTDSLRKVIEERELQNEKDRKKLEQGTDVPSTTSTTNKKKEKQPFMFIANPLLTSII